MAALKVGDCVRLKDGRVGRVRERAAGQERGKVRVRVRRRTSKTHQFVRVAAGDLEKVACPKGWMSEAGYVRYLRVTLRKMRERTKGK